MLRYVLSSVVVLSLGAVIALAADEPKNKDNKDQKKNEQKATITKVDRKNHEITLRMKNKEGKETERTFKLTDQVLYFDSTGKAAAADIFENGNDVLVVEEQGTLKQIKQHKKGSTTDKNNKSSDKKDNKR